MRARQGLVGHVENVDFIERALETCGRETGPSDLIF